MCQTLRSELFLQHPLLEIGLAVEQQGHRDVAVLADLDRDDIAHLGEIGDRADRALVGLQRLDPAPARRAATARRASAAGGMR